MTAGTRIETGDYQAFVRDQRSARWVWRSLILRERLVVGFLIPTNLLHLIREKTIFQDNIVHKTSSSLTTSWCSQVYVYVYFQYYVSRVHFRFNGSLPAAALPWPTNLTLLLRRVMLLSVLVILAQRFLARTHPIPGTGTATGLSRQSTQA